MARNSFQTGSVRARKTKRRGIVWELRYRVRDKSCPTGWRSVTETAPPECVTRKNALKLLSKRLAEVNGPNSTQSSSSAKGNAIKFAEFVDTDWGSYVENRSLKPSTLYGYRSMINKYLLPIFGEKLLTEIGPSDLTLFFERARTGKRKKYLLNLYALLRVMFEVAVENDRVERSPVRKKLHRPSTDDSTKTRKVALSAEAIQQVLSWIPGEYRTLFSLVAMTGVRVGELLGLRWSNVDFGRSEMSVTHSLWRRELVTPKTEASARTIHLAEVLTNLLAERKDSVRFNAPEDFVFGRVDGTPQDPDFLRKRVLYKAMKAAGIEPGYRTHGFHLFRHSAGSIVHSITRDVKTAQELLGHSRLSTTADIYTHVEKAVGEQASEALAKAITDQKIPLASERIQ